VTGGIAPNDVLKWNGTAFVPGTVGGGPFAIADATDVDVDGGIAQGSMFGYDGQKFVDVPELNVDPTSRNVAINTIGSTSVSAEKGIEMTAADGDIKLTADKEIEFNTGSDIQLKMNSDGVLQTTNSETYRSKILADSIFTTKGYVDTEVRRMGATSGCFKYMAFSELTEPAASGQFTTLDADGVFSISSISEIRFYSLGNRFLLDIDGMSTMLWKFPKNSKLAIRSVERSVPRGAIMILQMTSNFSFAYPNNYYKADVKIVLIDTYGAFVGKDQNVSITPYHDTLDSLQGVTEYNARTGSTLKFFGSGNFFSTSGAKWGPVPACAYVFASMNLPTYANWLSPILAQNVAYKLVFPGITVSPPYDSYISLNSNNEIAFSETLSASFVTINLSVEMKLKDPEINNPLPGPFPEPQESEIEFIIKNNSNNLTEESFKHIVSSKNKFHTFRSDTYISGLDSSTRLSVWVKNTTNNTNITIQKILFTIGPF
jgi:hypothetical protein